MNVIKIQLSVSIKNIKCRNLVTINDEVYDILDNTCTICGVWLEEFTISKMDKENSSVECSFTFGMPVENSDEIDEDELCPFINWLCGIYNLEPIKFTWRLA